MPFLEDLPQNGFYSVGYDKKIMFPRFYALRVILVPFGKCLITLLGVQLALENFAEHIVWTS